MVGASCARREARAGLQDAAVTQEQATRLLWRCIWIGGAIGACVGGWFLGGLGGILGGVLGIIVGAFLGTPRRRDSRSTPQLNRATAPTATPSGAMKQGIAVLAWLAVAWRVFDPVQLCSSTSGGSTLSAIRMFPWDDSCAAQLFAASAPIFSLTALQAVLLAALAIWAWRSGRPVPPTVTTRAADEVRTERLAASPRDMGPSDSEYRRWFGGTAADEPRTEQPDNAHERDLAPPPATTDQHERFQDPTWRS